jgi:hypothetical protein
VKNLKARAFALLNRGIDKLQETFPVNRVVILLTPIIFVPGAAVVSAWIGKNFPGVSFSKEAVVGFAAAGALSALTAAYKWIDGWQKHEANVQAAVAAAIAKRGLK